MSAEVLRNSLSTNVRRSTSPAAMVTRDGMVIRSLGTSAEGIDRIWQSLEQKVGFAGLACSWAWTETWIKHYGDLIPHRFIVAERREPVGVALLTEGAGKRIGPFPIRTLHLGTSGEPDSETVRVQYNRVLASACERAEFTRQVIEFVRATESRWDELHLDGFAPDDLTGCLLPDTAFETLRKVCHVTELAAIKASGKSLIEGLHGHAAKRIRKSIRLVEEELGPLRVEWAETIETARDIFEEMVRLHEARWAAEGHRGVFASRRFSGFHRELLERLFPSGGILLARVKAGDVTIGCDYSLIEHNRVLAYQWGIALLEDRRISPGLVTAVTVMQEAMDRGFLEYDWLAGDAYYKRQLTTTSRELLWVCTSQGTRIQAIYKLAEAKRLAHRLPLFGGAKATEEQES